MFARPEGVVENLGATISHRRRNSKVYFKNTMESPLELASIKMNDHVKLSLSMTGIVKYIGVTELIDIKLDE